VKVDERDRHHGECQEDQAGWRRACEIDETDEQTIEQDEEHGKRCALARGIFVDRETEYSDQPYRYSMEGGSLRAVARAG
jgi:hypothetical protein